MSKDYRQVPQPFARSDGQSHWMDTYLSFPYKYDFKQQIIISHRQTFSKTPVITSAAFTGLEEEGARVLAKTFTRLEFGERPFASFNDDLNCWQVTLGVRPQDAEYFASKGVSLAQEKVTVKFQTSTEHISVDQAADLYGALQEISKTLRPLTDAGELKGQLRELMDRTRALKGSRMERGADTSQMVSVEDIKALTGAIKQTYPENHQLHYAANEVLKSAGIGKSLGIQ